MISFVMKVLDIEYTEACEWLGDILGLSTSDLTLSSSKIASRERLKKLKTIAKKKTRSEYKQVSQVILNDIEEHYHPYMLKQGFKQDTLKHFNIGWCRYGELANRVVFPIDAPDGTIISLTGRSVDGSDPKYHVVSGSDKSKTLYNISRINKDDDYIIVVEGMMAVLDLYQWGFQSVVCVMGADISDDQLGLLLKLGKKVICIGDNDSAGRKLNQKIYNRLYKWLPVIKVDMQEFSDFEKDSPRTADIGFDGMCDLTDKLEEIINGEEN